MTTPDMESPESAPCIDCEKKQNVVLYRQIRNLRLLTALCAVFCIISIVACFSTSFLYFKMDSFRAELKKLVKEQQQQMAYPDYSSYADALAYGEDGDSTELTDTDGEQFQKVDQYGQVVHERHERGKGSKNKIPGKGHTGKGDRERRGKKKCCTVRKIKKMIAEMIRASTPKTRTTAKTITTTETPKDTHNTHYLAGAHYTTIVDEKFINDKLGPVDHGNLKSATIDRFITEWKGTLYRNRSLAITNAPLTLTFLYEAPWMKNSPTKLFRQTAGGKFMAEITGLYHVYAHVTILREDMTNVSIALLHESNERKSAVFPCLESANLAETKTQGYNTKYRSCSISGDLHVSKGDEFYLENLSVNIKDSLRVDLTRNSTYFGGWLVNQW